MHKKIRIPLRHALIVVPPHAPNESVLAARGLEALRHFRAVRNIRMSALCQYNS
jgi:hypothetical protein